MFAKCIIARSIVYISQDVEAEKNCEKGFDRWPCKKLDRAAELTIRYLH